MKIERLAVLLFMSENGYARVEKYKRKNADYFDGPTGARFDVFYDENDKIVNMLLSSGSYGLDGSSSIKDPKEKNLVDNLIFYLEDKGFFP